MVFDDDTSDDEDVGNDQQQGQLLSPYVRTLLLFIMVWQFLFNVSDAGIAVLIVFLHVLKLFHTVAGNDTTATWLVGFPSNLQNVRDAVIGTGIKFQDYVVCAKCHTLYDLEKCIERVGSRTVSKLCKYVPFPNHPTASF